MKEKSSVSDSSAVADSVTLDNDTLTADPEPIPVEDIQPSVSDSSAVADSIKWNWKIFSLSYLLEYIQIFKLKV